MELICTHCHEPVLIDEVPPVGAVMQCTLCKGISYVHAQYLIGERVGLLIQKVDKAFAEKVIKEMEALR
jgi:hypothetical protein